MGGYRKGIKIAELDESWHNVAVRDARLRDADAPAEGWPLIVFSHGSGGMRNGYVFLTEMLASHGYIVMAADHGPPPQNSSSSLQCCSSACGHFCRCIWRLTLLGCLPAVS